MYIYVLPIGRASLSPPLWGRERAHHPFSFALYYLFVFMDEKKIYKVFTKH
jgi:hypothetical protein